MTEDTLAWIARRLVDEPDAVRVEREDRDDAIVLLLHVAPDDVGKVIGKGGRIARSLRTLVRASGAKAGERRLVAILKDNPLGQGHQSTPLGVVRPAQA